MSRALILVLDSFGCGHAPDAARFGDVGADTLGHIAAHCAAGQADVAGLRKGPLHMPNLDALGLGAVARLATGSCRRVSRAAPQVPGVQPSSNRWVRTRPQAIGKLPVRRQISPGAIFPTRRRPFPTL